MISKLLFGFVFLTFFLFGCVSTVEVDENSCSADNDCACGTHVSTGACFYGNKAFVNTLKQCPDFCSGIGGNLKVVCLNNKCAQVSDQKPAGFCGRSTYGSCSASSDCTAGGCSGQVCQSKNEEPIITTCEYRDCYNPNPYNLKCQCISNKCQWGVK